MECIYRMFFIPWVKKGKKGTEEKHKEGGEEVQELEEDESRYWDTEEEYQARKKRRERVLKLSKEFYACEAENLDGGEDTPLEEDEEDKKNTDCPSFATFYRARWNETCEDVTVRPKHFHCRCKTCAKLNTIGLKTWRGKSFVTEFERNEWKVAFIAHRKEIQRWRRIEKQYQLLARHSPARKMIMSYDDTIFLGLPRTTNRAVKGYFLVCHFLYVPFFSPHIDVSCQPTIFHFSPHFFFGRQQITRIIK
jgi:hypothetical protein